MIRKNITITEEQERFVKERNINLSRLVQKVLDKDMDDWRFYQDSLEGLREIERGEYEEMSSEQLREEICRLESQLASEKRTGNSTPRRKARSSNSSRKSQKTPLLANQ